MGKLTFEISSLNFGLVPEADVEGIETKVKWHLYEFSWYFMVT
jgi:hypothetical protein